MRNKTIEDKVRRILELSPITRDNDRILLAAYWNEQCGGSDRTKQINANDFLVKLKNDNLDNPVTIWRTRQKLQELYPELRGKSYKVRKSHANTVKEEIINWNAENKKQEGLF